MQGWDLGPKFIPNPSHSFIVLNMGLEWRGPHRTLLVRLLHYVWIHIHYVNEDGSDRALKLRCWTHLVPPYYGAPQTRPGVQYNNDERNLQYLQYSKGKQDMKVRNINQK